MAGVRPYIVRQGDYVAKIADALGCSEDEIWKHDKNKGLIDDGRSAEVLAPGDVVYVPERTAEPAKFKLLSENRYQGAVATMTVRVAFKVDGEPRANKRFKVFDLGEPIEGASDGDGIAVFDVPTSARSVRVVFEEPHAAYQINVGFIDPARESSGAFERLRQLGYFSLDTTPDEVSGEDLRGAIASFQQHQNLDPTGDLDEGTIAKLESEFGS